MKKTLLALMATSVLGACGGGGLNPGTWGDNDTTAAPRADRISIFTAPPAEDTRVPVAQVLDVKVERTLEGAVVRATGLPPTQGWWQASLIPMGVQDGVLTYEFRAAPPKAEAAVSTQASREVTVATGLTRGDLALVNRIAVRGATNALVVAAP